MSYWGAKSDVEFLLRFRNDAFELMGRESKAAKDLRNDFVAPSDWRAVVVARATRSDAEGYQAVRQRLAVGMTRAVGITTKLNVPSVMTSYPAPAVGGPVIHFHILEALLNDPSHGDGLDRQVIVDTLNRVVGEAQEAVRRELLHMVNPAWWLWSLVAFVLRIPFIVVSATGFKVEKFENELWGRLLKVGEVVLIAFLLAKLGLQMGS